MFKKTIKWWLEATMKGMNKISRGHGFRGVLEYVFDNRKGDLGRIIGGNMSSLTPRSLTSEFAITRKLRPDIAKPVWHSSLRLPQGDRLTPEEWAIIARDYMTRMGYTQQHLYCVILHDAEEGQHIHIVASRIGLDGTIYYGKQENLESTKIISQLERDHRLSITKQRTYDHADKIVMPEVKTPTKSEIDAAIQIGKEPPRQKLQRLIDQAKSDQPNILQFIERLEMAGVNVFPNLASTGRMSGFAFEMDGVHFKASQLGDIYKWATLQREVIYEQDRDSETLGRYTKTARDHRNSRPTPTADQPVQSEYPDTTTDRSPESIPVTTPEDGLQRTAGAAIGQPGSSDGASSGGSDHTERGIEPENQADATGVDGSSRSVSQQNQRGKQSSRKERHKTGSRSEIPPRTHYRFMEYLKNSQIGRRRGESLDEASQDAVHQRRRTDRNRNRGAFDRITAAMAEALRRTARAREVEQVIWTQYLEVEAETMLHHKIDQKGPQEPNRYIAPRM
ncbi:relaxase/mobilization nuclease domain-containing protein [Halothiobacillus sp.]|uniref:relaxase/mobilization nuclease domain-containing protein n=1 Tax=Halothiobacillus sp. TaxID=1891311 RepID=UPI002621513E|nr:relaxase/mobilization nuclease domain-containing protein [Halothiobacillus sp.]MDD4965998.1 relaxase/mobilization nuclease domain-containing protein [Halothiobacillus sp.]